MSRLTDFIHEIHRRSLWQVLGIYLGTSWLIFQGVQALVEGLQLPDWIPGFAVILLLIGLPIVLATAFVQEGMGGQEPAAQAEESDADGTPARAVERLFTWRNAIGGGVLAAALWGVVAAGWLLFVGDLSSLRPPENVAEAESPSVLHNSIAVLPFENLSPDPDDAFFAAGIHEEILNQLTKIKDLSVIARTTMLRYADSGKSVPEIAAELDVETVMEGSVRYAGNRVRISAQLIDAETGSHLWSEAYEDDLDDVFGIQLAIATRIAETLEAEFSPVEKQRVAAPATSSPDAYAHYLKALSQWGNFAPTGPVHRALDAAIAADPGFAAALAFKAWIHSVEASFGSFFVGPHFDADEQARLVGQADRFADAALRLDNQQARAYLALNVVNLMSRNWEQARRDSDRAYTLNPNDYVVNSNSGWNLASWGDFEAGARRVRRSMELNPGDVANIWNVAVFFYLQERWEESERLASVVTRMAPDAAFGHALLARASARLGRTDVVRRHAALAESLDPGAPALADIASAYGLIGDLDEARRIFELARAGDVERIPDLYFQFQMHMAIRDHDRGLDYLERAIEQNFPAGVAVDLRFRSRHPIFDPIRSDPRFEALVRRVAVPL